MVPHPSGLSQTIKCLVEHTDQIISLIETFCLFQISHLIQVSIEIRSAEITSVQIKLQRNVQLKSSVLQTQSL